MRYKVNKKYYAELIRDDFRIYTIKRFYPEFNLQWFLENADETELTLIRTMGGEVIERTGKRPKENDDVIMVDEDDYAYYLRTTLKLEIIREKHPEFNEEWIKENAKEKDCYWMYNATDEELIEHVN